MDKMALPAKTSINPRKALLKYGACSHAMFCIINREFENKQESEEKASDILAGGIHKGYQCGLLWGSSLAIGTEAYKRFGNKATYAAITASRDLVDSFRKRAKAMDCRDISKTNWENRVELILYMIKALAHGFICNPCFNLIAKWSPEAVATINTALEKKPDQNRLHKSCASEVIKRMGASNEESIMVAGFAGGIGLSGNVCGALGAAIWYTILEWQHHHPGKSLSMLNNPYASEKIRALYKQTDSEMLCSMITGKTFKNPDEHTEYIENGGCSKIIEALSANHNP
jgi:hypothetical protein